MKNYVCDVKFVSVWLGSSYNSSFGRKRNYVDSLTRKYKQASKANKYAEDNDRTKTRVDSNEQSKCNESDVMGHQGCSSEDFHLEQPSEDGECTSYFLAVTGPFVVVQQQSKILVD